MPGRHTVSSFVSNYCISTLNMRAFAMRVLISPSSDKLLSIVEPRYVKLSTALSVTMSMLIDGGEPMPWPITFFLDDDSQSKLLASVGEPVYQLLQVFHCMSHQCSIICERQFSDDDMSHCCFGSQPTHVVTS